MNILYLFYGPMVPFVGGVQRVTENLAVELKKRGHNVYYFNTDVNEPDFGYIFPVPSFSVSYSADQDKAIEDYKGIIGKYNINVVINQEAREDLLHILSYTPMEVKRITCIHLQPFFYQSYYKDIIKDYNMPGLKAKLYKTFCTLFPSYYYKQTLELYRESLRQATEISDYVCLLSDKFLPRIKRYMPEADESKFIAVNNPNTFNSSKTLLSNKKKQILWVGRHENAQKKFPLFVDFWVKYSELHPDWDAIVLGNGKDWEYNKSYVLKKGARHLSFLGNQKEVSKFYSEASFLVVTSCYEGWGMVLTEAMNYGCIPCAFDTFESLQDIIDNKINGIVIPPFDIDKMVSEIDGLVKNPDQMMKMRENCRTKSSQFSVERIADKWETILNTI